MLGTKPLSLGRAANALNQQAILPSPKARAFNNWCWTLKQLLTHMEKKKKKTKINLYLYLAIVFCVIFHKLKLNITLNV